MAASKRNAIVLVADDDEVFLDFISTALEKEGYEVICANDGNEALQAILHDAIDVILLDVGMPQWDGIALCRIIKSSPDSRLIPVVLVTRNANSLVRMEAIEAGADGFLTKPVDIQELFARLRSLVKLKFYTDELEHTEAVLFSLAKSIEARDRYTRGHCDRLSAYSVALAQRLNLPEDQCVALRRAGIVHDIGKVVVPDEILLKTGPLSPREWELMKFHPVVGADICSPLKTFRLVLPIIRHHHERMDGSGYPDGLKGDQIPITARVLTVVDVFDALTSQRSYKKALTVTDALETMSGETCKGILDPLLLREFESIIFDPNMAVVATRKTYPF